MLTLSSIASRISELEEETYHDEDERLSTWLDMVTWQCFIHSYGDNWHALPRDHWIWSVYDRLMWFPIWKFSDVLPSPNDNWRSEKIQIAFGAWLSVAIEEGYTQEALSCSEAMNDCLSFVSNALTNDDYWTKFHEQKRKEYEFWELQQKYRRMAHEGRLSEEAEEWLRINDSAFLENLNAKKETRPEVVKPITTEAIPPALPEILPETTKPKSDNYILAHWAGLDENWLIDTLDGSLPVFRNREYRLSLQTWQNIESDSYLRQRWHRISNE